MFSYRHAFHAGNHADVLKHLVLQAVMRHMVLKDTPFTVFDTHAGAGLYRLDGDYAQTSAEAAEGYLRLMDHLPAEPAPLLQDYLEMVAGFNTGSARKVYPGSPFIIQRLLRDRDKLKLFELHPTDTKTLAANVAQLEAGRQVAQHMEDGFEGIKPFLPPPTRRGLVLCDPSYEMKNDYAKVQHLVADSLQRFATGVYMVWHPLMARAEAHDLPKRLRTLAQRAGKPWLAATLTVKGSKLTRDEEGETVRPGLPASGVFLINPPYTLKDGLKLALPQLVAALGQDRNAAFTLDSGG